MDLATKIVLAEFVLDNLKGEAAVQWACDLLEAGEDSYHLRILAGIHPADFDRDLFKRVLKELALTLPSKEEAVKERLIFYLQGYLEGRFSVLESLSIAHQICIDLSHPTLLLPLYYLYEELDYPYQRDPTEESFTKEVAVEIEKILANISSL